MRPRRLAVTMALLVALCVWSGASTANAGGAWSVTQLPGSSGYHYSLRLSGDRAAWLGWDGSQWQVFTQRIGADAAPLQLTSDAEKHLGLALSGDRLAWSGLVGGVWQVFTQRIGTDAAPVQLTHAAYSESSGEVAVSGDRVVWIASDNTDWHVANDQVYTQVVGVDVSPVQVTTDVEDHSTPQVSGDRIVWVLGSLGVAIPNPQIFTEKIGVDSSPVQLTNDSVNLDGGNTNWAPQVSGDRVVWLHGSQAYYSQVLTELVGTDPEPWQLTSDANDHDSPQVSGDRIAWQVQGTGYTLKFGVDPAAVALPGVYPGIFGDRVAWWMSDGTRLQIYSRLMGADGTATRLSTDAQSLTLTGIYQEPSNVVISGDRVAWDTSAIDWPWWPDTSHSVAGPVYTALSSPDTIPPVTASDVVAYYASAATVHLGATDDGGSGVAHTYFALGGGAPFEADSFTVDTPGTYTLTYWSVDGSGNTESPHSRTFTIIVPPTGGKPSTPSTPATVRHGASFTTFGYVMRHTAGTYPVTLQFYRYQSGRWVLKKSVAAKASNMLTFSKYSRSTYVPYSGKWRVRARHYTGGRYLYSGWRYFTAT